MIDLRNLLILGVSTTLVACGDDKTETPPVEPKGITAVTYNAGLAVGFVEASEARAPHTIDAIAAMEADITCVQEVWRDEHVQLLTNATGDALPNASFIDPDPGTVGDAACTTDDTADLLTCVSNAGCDMLCPDSLVGCAQANCIVEITALPSVCFECITANIGQSIDDIVDNCESGSTDYAYEGSFGIGLLTSHQVLASDELVLDSTTNRRGVLYNHLDTPLGEVHAFCTHLTAVFDDLPYPGMYDSWEQEQNLQVQAMLDWIDEKTGGEGAVLAMGDFNNGPVGADYEAEAPDNYDLLMNTGGFANIYIDTPGHQCTYCADNPIIAKDNSNDDTKSGVIDHVLVRDFEAGTASATAKRVGEDSLQVENCEETIDTALSDHYGVSVDITEQ